MNELIYFSHIPKAAGSTFSSILRQNYRSQYCTINHGFYEGFISQECLDWQLKENFYKAIGGHRISFDVPYGSNEFDVRCIAFIRNPAERLYSEYRYLKKLGTSQAVISSKSFLDFVTRVARDDNLSWYSNTQSKYQTLDPRFFNELVETNRLLLFPVDRFNDSLLVLKRLINGLRNISYVSSNVNYSYPPNTDTTKILAGIPPSLIDKDLELYFIANEILDRLLAEFTPCRAERVRFKLNCILKRPINLTRSALVAASNRIDSLNI